MKFTINIDEKYIIPDNRFNNYNYIEKRINQTPKVDQGALKTTLKYLYFYDGPINLPSDRLKKAEKYLDECEKILARWLFYRTNGKLRSTYGVRALRAARAARYRCCQCRYPDVRALHLDHVEGRIKNASFSCLCANCHSIKTKKQIKKTNKKKK